LANRRVLGIVLAVSEGGVTVVGKGRVVEP
jgi:hypothetical protein